MKKGGIIWYILNIFRKKNQKNTSNEFVDLINPSLCKHPTNPIIEPNPKNPWEAWQVFNSAALYLNNRVHFLYRALGPSGLSAFGYASSPDGISIDERLSRPVYNLTNRSFSQKKRRSAFPNACFNYFSGGSWAGGCEDPRTVCIDDRVYVNFNAFDNWYSIRTAFLSIKKNDFINKKWHWSPVKHLSPLGQRHKNWILFPEKIHGKFALFHNLHHLSPDKSSYDPSRVLIEYIDDIDSFDPNYSQFESPDPQQIPSQICAWHFRMRSIGPPPVKTEKGWLVFYHAMDKRDASKYKLGAMILDLNDPTQVLYRAQEPVLEPGSYYENNGFKPGIVYSCGAVVVNGKLHVYYGGADTVVCVATAQLDEFVNSLISIGKPKLKKTRKVRKRKYDIS